MPQVAVRPRAKRKKAWFGSRQQGVSIERVDRKNKPPYWQVKMWLGGRMTRQPEDFPIKADALDYAKYRRKKGWYD